jgi:hypothetical protein
MQNISLTTKPQNEDKQDKKELYFNQKCFKNKNKLFLFFDDLFENIDTYDYEQITKKKQETIYHIKNLKNIKYFFKNIDFFYSFDNENIYSFEYIFNYFKNTYIPLKLNRKDFFNFKKHIFILEIINFLLVKKIELDFNKYIEDNNNNISFINTIKTRIISIFYEEYVNNKIFKNNSLKFLIQQNKEIHIYIFGSLLNGLLKDIEEILFNKNSEYINKNELHNYHLNKIKSFVNNNEYTKIETVNQKNEENFNNKPFSILDQISYLTTSTTLFLEKININIENNERKYFNFNFYKELNNDINIFLTSNKEKIFEELDLYLEDSLKYIHTNMKFLSKLINYLDKKL